MSAPLALATAGAVFGVFAVADKLFGLVQRPMHLALVAYVFFFALLLWASVRGVPRSQPQARPLRLSGYAAFLIINVLTAGFVLAWKRWGDPTPVMLQSRLAEGDALLAAGDKDGAHLVYRDALKRYPNLYSVLMRMGSVNYQTGDYEKAERYFQKALQTAPGDFRWQVLNYLGQSCWKLKRPEEAIAYYEQAREAGLPMQGPAAIEWHYLLGWAYFDVKNYDAAIFHYGEVAAAGEKYAAASYYNMACAEAQKARLSRDAAEKRRLVRDAVDNLRRAWRATTSQQELQALREGLVGTKEQRDPELEPLQGAEELTAFLREVRGV